MKTLKRSPLRIIAALALLFLASAPVAAQAITAATPPRPTGSPVPPLVQSWMDAWNSGDAQAMADLFTENGVYQDFAFGARAQGQAGVSSWVGLTVQNIPDAHGVILDAFQTGDRAAVQWVFSGTPLRMGPVEGTGESFSVPATSVFILKGGRIQAVHDYYNRAEIFRQLGLPTDAFSF